MQALFVPPRRPRLLPDFGRSSRGDKRYSKFEPKKGEIEQHDYHLVSHLRSSAVSIALKVTANQAMESHDNEKLERDESDSETKAAQPGLENAELGHGSVKMEKEDASSTEDHSEESTLVSLSRSPRRCSRSWRSPLLGHLEW